LPVVAAIKPQAITSAKLKLRRDIFAADCAAAPAARMRSAIDCFGTNAPPAASIAMRWSGGALRKSTP
jgi:hypothetical protein